MARQLPPRRGTVRLQGRDIWPLGAAEAGQGLTVILTLDDPTLGAGCADRVLVLSGGMNRPGFTGEFVVQ